MSSFYILSYVHVHTKDKYVSNGLECFDVLFIIFYVMTILKVSVALINGYKWKWIWTKAYIFILRQMVVRVNTQNLWLITDYVNHFIVIEPMVNNFHLSSAIKLLSPRCSLSYQKISISSGFHSNKVDWVCLIRHFYLFFHPCTSNLFWVCKSRANLVEISSI